MAATLHIFLELSYSQIQTEAADKILSPCLSLLFSLEKLPQVINCTPQRTVYFPANHYWKNVSGAKKRVPNCARVDSTKLLESRERGNHATFAHK